MIILIRTTVWGELFEVKGDFISLLNKNAIKRIVGYFRVVIRYENLKTVTWEC